jgi:hypothetical protein
MAFLFANSKRMELSSALANTVTAYLLQQIQLLAPRNSHGLAPWSATGNRSAEPTFQFGYEACPSQRAPNRPPGSYPKTGVMSGLATNRPEPFCKNTRNINRIGIWP